MKTKEKIAVLPCVGKKAIDVQLQSIVSRFKYKSFRFFSPPIHDFLKGGSSPQRFETLGEIIRIEEPAEMFSELLVRVLEYYPIKVVRFIACEILRKPARAP